ncbi:cytochrome c oxidase subunit 3 [Phenylobacterium soli]|uniref:Cytochrome C oxidase subunit III n=1 Tax=Phenylobacterium soli TaxID=2170551 RepID=A0A328AI92_9CAUL|nr:cytochrome C oxidase subunit III [Phenylobacterium soli]RAK53104.1 cytochrome C oxidase subunit III [Phenylobacterium soli]
MKAPRGLDLSTLPASGFRSHSLWYWAGCAFMLMESAGFALGCAAYVYLMNANSQWPLATSAPDLFWGTAQTVLLLVSLYPTILLSRASRRLDRAATRKLAVIVAILNAICLVIRAFEFPHLNTRWDQDAYGSVTWALMLLHTVHLITDFVDTGFLTVFLFTHPVSSERLSDVDDDAVYWSFVVATWLPIYLLVYWAPRWAP